MNNTTPSQLVICTLPKTQPRYYRICFQQTVLVNFLKKWFILAIAKIKEKKYIFAFTCQRFSCCKKIQPSDVAVMSFTLGKLLHSARYKLEKFVGRVQVKVKRKDFTEAWRRLCVQLCFQLLTPPLCFVLSRLVWMQLNIIRNVKRTNLWYVTTSRFTHFQVNFLGVKTTRM